MGVKGKHSEHEHSKMHLSEHAMVGLFDLIGQMGQNSNFYFNSVFRDEGHDIHNVKSSHAYASAIDINVHDEKYREVIDFFFSDYKHLPKSQMGDNFNKDNNRKLTLTEEGKKWLEKHNARILDERGRGGSGSRAHFHIDFFHPSIFNEDKKERSYKFYENGVHVDVNWAKGGAFVYGNRNNSYKANEYTNSEEYKSILKQIENTKIPHSELGSVYDISPDSAFQTDTLPNLDNIYKGITVGNPPPVIKNDPKDKPPPRGEGKSVNDFLDTKAVEGKKVLKANKELQRFATHVHELSDNEKKELDKQIFENTKLFNNWLEGNNELPELKGEKVTRDDDRNRNLYVKFMQERLSFDADDMGTIKSLKELSNSNTEELGKKRAIIDYLVSTTKGNDYAINITGEEPSALIKDSNLLNMMQDGNYNHKMFYSSLQTPNPRESLLNYSENFVPKSYIEQLKEDGIYDYFVHEGKFFNKFVPGGITGKSIGKQPGIQENPYPSIYEGNRNFYVDKFIRKNNLNTVDYKKENAEEFFNNYYSTESKNAEQKYAEYQQSQKPKDEAPKGKQNTADPQEIYNYLTKEKGLSHTHAMGMLANIAGESSFNIGAIGDNGTSGGLFQHHNSEEAEEGEGRFDRMKKSVGDDWETNWKGQIDYTLDVEKDPGLVSYLGKDFDTEQDATYHFMKHFERPADQSRENSDKRYNKLINNFGASDAFKGGAVSVNEETVNEWSNPLSGKEELIGRISISSTEEGLARILKDGQEITGRDGAIKVKGIRAEGDKLVVESNFGDQDFGYFEKKNGAYVFVPGRAYEMFQSSDAVTQEDRDIFDAFLFGVQNDNRFADGVMNVVSGAEGNITGTQLYENLNEAPDGWSPTVTVTPGEKSEGFYAVGADGTVYWNTVDPKDKDKRVITAFGNEDEYLKHRKANGFPEDFSGIDQKVEGSQYESLYADARKVTRDREDGIQTSNDAKDTHNKNLNEEQDDKLIKEADNAITMLKVAGGAAGLGLAMKTLPIGDAPEISQSFKSYIDRVKHLSETGLSAEEMAAAKNDLAEAYSVGTKNVLRASGGSRGTFLANMGMLNANRVNGLMKLNAMDQTVKRQNLQQLGNALTTQEKLTNRSGELTRKMEYEESLRKANIAGAMGSTLIGQALGDLAYNQAKPNVFDDLTKNLFLKEDAQNIKTDTPGDIQITNTNQEDNT